MTTVTLYGTPAAQHVARGNNIYQADANGQIPSVALADEADLLAQGCIPEAIWLLLKTAHPAAGGPSAGTAGTVQKSDGSGAFVASSIVDNGTHVTISEPVLVAGSLISGSGTVTASAGAATLNTQNGIVTSEALTGASTYTLTLANSTVLSNSTVLVTAYDGTNAWAPTAITATSSQVVIALKNLGSALTGTAKIAFAVLN